MGTRVREYREGFPPFLARFSSSVLKSPPIIMGTLNTYFCDICGTTKQKSNNWYVVTGSKSNKPRSFRVVVWSEALAGENVAVCGSECLQKTLSQWLTQTQSNQK